MTFDVGMAKSCFPGEMISGDLHYLKANLESALIVVIDGAGHGHEAADAARAVVPVLDRFSEGPLNELFKHVHTTLKRTRGAAMSAALIDLRRSVLTWAGIGNVEGVVIRADSESAATRETLLLRNGILGYESINPRIASMSVCPGDILIFVTDGVAAAFLKDVDFDGSAQQISDAILERHGKDTDDAMVLVARFTEEAT